MTLAVVIEVLAQLLSGQITHPANGAGQPPVAPLTTQPVAWDATFIVSACRLADGAVLARVTFAEKTNAAEFELGGRKVSIQRPAGSLGAWVKLPPG